LKGQPLIVQSLDRACQRIGALLVLCVLLIDLEGTQGFLGAVALSARGCELCA